MSEDFSIAELVIPGTYIRVRAEGLITAGGIPTGNIGVVGTATKDSSIYGVTHNFSDYATAKETLGPYDAYANKSGKLHLTRALELLFMNGARTVYARALDPVAGGGPGKTDFTNAFTELAKDNVNILVAPQLSTADALEVLGAAVTSIEGNGRDVMAVVGSDAATVSNVLGQAPTNGRIILVTPGIRAYDAVAKEDVELDGTFSALPVAGLLCTLPPQASPTNKTLPGVGSLVKRYAYGEVKDLVSGRVLVLEERSGVRVVRGVTTDDGAFKQITTRRITDFAKAGIRQVSNPFIGRLNNERVRKALRGAIDGFLTTMVQDEALINYSLEVVASRQDEIAGRAMVNVILQPTFSIDYIAVTLVLQ